MPFFSRLRRPSVENRRRSVKKAKKQRKRMFRRALAVAFNRQVRLFLAIFLGYFLDVTFFSMLGETLGVSLMLTLSVIAVITVCYGRLQAFWCGMIYGILMELMLPGTSLLNLFVYPASALLWSVPFADKSSQQLEYERSIGKAGRNRSPVLRTLLCGMTNSLTYEVVNLFYIYLRESGIQGSQVRTSVQTVFVTVILTFFVMLVLRPFFGYSRRQPPDAAPQPYRA